MFYSILYNKSLYYLILYYTILYHNTLQLPIARSVAPLPFPCWGRVIAIFEFCCRARAWAARMNKHELETNEAEECYKNTKAPSSITVNDGKGYLE